VDKTHIFNHLKKDVERKFGSEIKYSKQCQLLVEQIFEMTDRQLSISTIKRVFGIIHSSFKPSRYTLDTLSSYVGFENWNQYKKREDGLSQNKNTHSLNDIIKNITESSLNSILYKTRYDSRKYIHRIFATRFLKNFINSERTATMLVAPKGYGKSSILLQWIEDLSSDARYEDDTICLIDGGIYFALYSITGSGVVLNQIIDFDIKDCPGLFMKNRTEGEANRYIIVIDDIDEVFPGKDKYFILVKNIMQLILMNKVNPYFKLIFTCRPENLDPFTSLINQNPLLADLWYHVRFFNKNHLEAINVPLFNQKELNALPGINGNRPYDYYTYYHPDIVNVICHPQYFASAKDHFEAPGSTETGYLDNLIQQIIYSPPYTAEKQKVVKKFLKLCNLAEKVDYVDKELLIESTDCQIAYQELLASGVFHEYYDTNNSFDIKIKIRFSNASIFEHLLFRFITQGITPDSKFIIELLLKYKSNPGLRSKLLKGLIKYAFSLKKYSLLRLIFTLEGQSTQDSNGHKIDYLPEYFLTAHEAYISCLRSDKSLQAELLPWMAKSQLGRIVFYEELFDVDNLKNFPLNALSSYLNFNPTIDGEVIASFIKFLRGFYLLNEVSCQSEWKKVQKIHLQDLTDPVAIRHYFSMAFLYNTYFPNDNIDNLLTMVLLVSNELMEKSIQKATSIPFLELMVVSYLNICNLFKDIQALSKHLETSYIPSDPDSSCYWQYYKLCLARSYLHTGNPSLAIELYRQFKAVPFPVHHRHFMQLNTDLIKVEFLIYMKKEKEAILHLHDIKIMAHFLDNRFLGERAKELELDIISKNLA
jgi:hypothetical protein